MRHLQFVTVFVSFWQLGEFATLANIEHAENMKDLDTKGQAVSPLGLQSIKLENKFIFEAAVPVKYKFNISELLRTEEIINAELPSPEKCKGSPMFTLFCSMVNQGKAQMQKDLEVQIREITGVHNQTKASVPILPQLTHLSYKNKGNGTSDFLEALKSAEESLTKNATRTIKRCIAEITARPQTISKPRVRNLVAQTLFSIWNQRLTRVTLIKEVLTKCQHNKLPQMLVNSHTFDRDLDSLRSNLNKSGFEIAVSSFDEHSIVDCNMNSEQQLQVIVYVPVRQTGKWALTSMKPFPFMFKGEKCRIFPFADTTIATIDNQYVVIDKVDFEKIPGGIYVVRQNSEQQNYACLEGLMNSTSTQNVKDVCPFSCDKTDSSISAVKLEESKYLVSGAKVMKIQCGQNEKDILFPEIGSLVIDKGACGCEITVHKNNDTRKFKSSRLFCTPLHKDEKFPETTHVIPSEWTKTPEKNFDLLQHVESITKVANTNLSSVDYIFDPSDSFKEKFDGLRKDMGQESYEEFQMEMYDIEAEEYQNEMDKEEDKEYREEEEKIDGYTEEIENMEKETTPKEDPSYIWAIAATLVLFLLSSFCVFLRRRVADARNKANQTNSVKIELHIHSINIV